MRRLRRRRGKGPMVTLENPSGRPPAIDRRTFLASAGAALAGGVLPDLAHANVPTAYDWTLSPPTDSRAHYVNWMTQNRGEDPQYLGLRYDRFVWMVNS